MVQIVWRQIRSISIEVIQLTWMLFRIIIPVLILIRILEQFGVIALMAKVMAPLMILMGLPGEMALAWITALATGVYGGLTVFFTSPYAQTLTVAQVSVLGALILISHGLPLEGSIAKRVGITWLVTLTLRLLGGFAFAVLLNSIYRITGYLQTPNRVPVPTISLPKTWTEWLIAQIQSLAMVIVIIAALVVVLRILRYLHVERAMAYLLSPVLKLLGISPKAVNITIIGLTIGLSYGGGLLIKAAETDDISKHDIFTSIALLSLSHSVIEDTLLMMLMGAHLSAILWGRLLFTFVIIAVLSRWIKGLSPEFTQRYLIR